MAKTAELNAHAPQENNSSFKLEFICKEENKCPLCHLETSKFTHFIDLGVPGIDRYPVAETDHFFVKPDVLPGNPDGRHMLIFPKFHTYNFAQLATPEIIVEVGSLMKELEGFFGPLVVFEHGGLKDGQNHQSVYHAHTHAYGGLEGADVIAYMHDMLNGALEPDGLAYPHTIIPAPDYSFLANLREHFEGTPYLYIQQGHWAIYASDPNGIMRSQITQRAMHNLFSRQELDWKRIQQHREWGDDWGRLSAQRIMNLIHWHQHNKPPQNR